MVIMVVTIGLSFLDFTLAFTLGGIMLLTLFLMPHCFIVREKAPGKI
ncbi:ABC transporter, CydDC cysteine exporter (CydDC-E) family, permease/ATP-binding CydC domain protein [Escherichia coli]|nr:ABC transporter, CydDC cysteine exporter (CydDC-E) family, permease/ATP-binding CydC domain protein [Escherichia coli]